MDMPKVKASLWGKTIQATGSDPKVMAACIRRQHRPEAPGSKSGRLLEQL